MSSPSFAEPEGAYRRWPAPGRGKRGLQSPAHSKPRRAELHQGPAKEITFDFSAPVEDASGFVLSDLRFFKEGLPFLEPEAQITHHWDYLPNLIPMLKERGLEDGIKVTTKYKDLADESYETEWTLHPLLLESDHRIERSKDMNDLVNVAEEISGAGVGRDGRQKAANGGEGHSGPR